jgi:hypothetical protein
LKAFSNISLRSACFTFDAFSLVKSKTSGLRTTARLSGFLNYWMSD